MYSKTCRNCGNGYTNPRADSVYCCDNCKAQYDRAQGTNKGYVHAEKERWTSCSCEHCGGTFWVNDYAVRGGQRRARFCTTRCRVAYFRAQKKTYAGETYQGHSTHERNRNTPPKQGNTPPKQGNTSPPNQKVHYYTHRDGLAKAFEWLGVANGADLKTCKRAYIKMIKAYHPDTSKAPNANELSQATNAAFEVISKHYNRK
jgi:DnaJ-domain-containing protein 1